MFAVMGLTVSDGVIAEIQLLADPDRLQAHLASLDA